jgi:hypothetical protein
VRGEDPFAWFERDVNYWELPDETVELALDDLDLPQEDRQLRFLVNAGLFDMLMEVLWQVCESDEERGREAARILGKLQSVEPTLRFDLFEKGDVAQRTELMSRMRGKEVAVTESFLLPRLEHGLHAYEERIEALRAALRQEAR